ncbi:hypothetical protein DdX_17514 [Ditylenchus destructor]|uniref:Uncharacterized protein n=1 Tax=Ditylenchus destructor TaxID=166010 RepID=A0AAD4MRT6_9BILA|nr:hypothetical protein DdX_17514 [Ditylenchus destructor]
MGNPKYGQSQIRASLHSDSACALDRQSLSKGVMCLRAGYESSLYGQDWPLDASGWAGRASDRKGQFPVKTTHCQNTAPSVLVTFPCAKFPTSKVRAGEKKRG